MKVHYKKTILQRIDDEINKAAKELRKIDFIELTYEEWKKLAAIIEAQSWCGFKARPYDFGKPILNLSEVFYDGIKLIQETRMV